MVEETLWEGGNSMKKTFLGKTSPFITEMVQVPTKDIAKEKITTAINGGATAIGFQLGHLEKRYRDKQTLTEIFACAQNKPIYLTNYRKFYNEGMSDDQLMDGLMLGLECGATLLDIMGDTFDQTEGEMTYNESAVAKQMKFIDQVHKNGGEVLMSSHVLKYQDGEQVLSIALAQQSRGVDVVKIVTGADTPDQEYTNLQTCALLKRELKVPFLFLSGGKCSYLHRTLGPAFGVNMWLCFSQYDDTTYDGPPLLEDVLKIKEGLKI